MTAFFEYTNQLGYTGAFIAGILFVSVFTSAAAMVVLFELGQQYNVWWITLIAVLGTVIGDFLILRFFENSIVDEFNLLMKKIGMKRLAKKLRQKRMRGLLIVTGIGIIGSPLPDEIGIGILDISHLGTIKILAICLTANLVGVLLVTGTGYLAS